MFNKILALLLLLIPSAHAGIPLSSQFTMGSAFANLDDRYWAADVTARNAIPSYSRQTGLLCYEDDNNTLYILEGGILNTNWVAIGSGGSSYTFADSLVNTSGTVTLVNDNPAPSPSNYYGTDGSGTLGYYALPAGGGGGGGDLAVTLGLGNDAANQSAVNFSSIGIGTSIPGSFFEADEDTNSEPAFALLNMYGSNGNPIGIISNDAGGTIASPTPFPANLPGFAFGAGFFDGIGYSPNGVDAGIIIVSLPSPGASYISPTDHGAGLSFLATEPNTTNQSSVLNLNTYGADFAVPVIWDDGSGNTVTVGLPVGFSGNYPVSWFSSLPISTECVSIDPSGRLATAACATSAVSGPGSSTNRSFATWNGTTGKVLFDNPNTKLDSHGNATFNTLSIEQTDITGGDYPFFINANSGYAESNPVVQWDYNNLIFFQVDGYGSLSVWPLPTPVADLFQVYAPTGNNQNILDLDANIGSGGISTVMNFEGDWNINAVASSAPAIEVRTNGSAIQPVAEFGTNSGNIMVILPSPRQVAIDGQLQVTADTPSTLPVLINANNSQTANLTEWFGYSNILGSVDKNGSASFPGLTLWTGGNTYFPDNETLYSSRTYNNVFTTPVVDWNHIVTLTGSAPTPTPTSTSVVVENTVISDQSVFAGSFSTIVGKAMTFDYKSDRNILNYFGESSTVNFDASGSGTAQEVDMFYAAITDDLGRGSKINKAVGLHIGPIMSGGGTAPVPSPTSIGILIDDNITTNNGGTGTSFAIEDNSSQQNLFVGETNVGQLQTNPSQFYVYNEFTNGPTKLKDLPTNSMRVMSIGPVSDTSLPVLVEDSTYFVDNNTVSIPSPFPSVIMHETQFTQNSEGVTHWGDVIGNDLSITSDNTSGSSIDYAIGFSSEIGATGISYGVNRGINFGAENNQSTTAIAFHVGADAMAGSTNYAFLNESSAPIKTSGSIELTLSDTSGGGGNSFRSIPEYQVSWNWSGAISSLIYSDTVSIYHVLNDATIVVGSSVSSFFTCFDNPTFVVVDCSTASCGSSTYIGTFSFSAVNTPTDQSISYNISAGHFIETYLNAGTCSNFVGMGTMAIQVR